MKKSLTLPCGIVRFQNLDTQAPQVEPLFFGIKKERPAIAQPRQGIEHGTSSQNSQTFAPVPIAPCLGSYGNHFFSFCKEVKLVCMRSIILCSRVKAIAT